MGDSSAIQQRKDIDIELQATQQSKSVQEKTKQRGGSNPAQKQSSVISGLSFSPYAEYVVTIAIYLLFLCGICSFGSSFKKDYLEDNEFYVDWFQFSAGIYSILIAVFLALWQVISSFDKVDKSIGSILEPREWPAFITLPLTFFHNHLVQCIACIVLSAPTFVSPLTAVAGVGLIIAAFLFFVGFVRREKSRKITGIR